MGRVSFLGLRPRPPLGGVCGGPLKLILIPAAMVHVHLQLSVLFSAASFVDVCLADNQ
jgi:hypothetical protein